MPSQITIKSSSSNKWSQQQKQEQQQSPTKTTTHRKTSSNVGEVAGGTTADICVVCCCCPCVLFECFILAIYKAPKSILTRLWKKQRQKMINKKDKKKKIVEIAKESQSQCCNTSTRQHAVVGYVDELSDVDWKEFEKVKVSIDGSAEAVELDKLMWDRFKDGGFWRSPSRRLDEIGY